MAKESKVPGPGGAGLWVAAGGEGGGQGGC